MGLGPSTPPAHAGGSPGLLEHLGEVFPRHVVLHYGQYKREQLFEAAQRSRACAYLADDDHGPLALQEILMVGYPTVGVRTGAPFIRDSVTGIFVDRLSPGAKCMKNDADAVSLAAFVERIQRIQQFSRVSIRRITAENMSAPLIVGHIVQSLGSVRERPY